MTTCENIITIHLFKLKVKVESIKVQINKIRSSKQKLIYLAKLTSYNYLLEQIARIMPNSAQLYL